MGANPCSYTLAELAGKVKARLQGDAGRKVSGLATLQSAGPEDVTFLSNPKYRSQLAHTRAAAVICDPDTAVDCPIDCLVHDDPYLAFAQLSHSFNQAPQPGAGVDSSASTSESASIARSASVASNAVIMENVQLGERVVVGANTVIAAGTIIGDDTTIMPNVTIYHGVRIGSHCTIHAGAVIGSDGFGYAPVIAGRGPGTEGQPCWQKIAQLGSVRVGDRVEIGANTTIDRGALDDTVIEDDVIIDNQVQVAHNVVIGRGTAIAGCVGIAGSATIGQYCSIGGGAGISGHLSIADGTTVLGMTLINRSVNQAGIYASGTGMQEAGSWRKSAVRFTQLERLNNRVKQLEKALAALDRAKGNEDSGS